LYFLFEDENLKKQALLRFSQKTDITLFIATIVNAESFNKRLLSNIFIMFTRESYVKHNFLMLVQGNVRRVKKFGVVAGESGRGLNITLRLVTLPLVIPRATVCLCV
jgi:hypothetical protein